jgi:putative spermidine/putrescine transport system permease protein
VLATSQNTLPLELWAMLTVQIIEPDLYALGTLTTLVTFVIVGALFNPALLGQLRRVSSRRAE